MTFGPTAPPSLPDAIADLRIASDAFCAAWGRGDLVQCARSSEMAVKFFDTICNIYLRRRDDLKASGTYNGTPLEVYLKTPFGRIVTGTTVADHQANAGHPNNWGRAALPAHLSASQPEFVAVLNKVKHRNDAFSNFRVSSGQHILVFCGMNPNYMIELSVHDFCDQAEAGIAYL